MCGCASNAPNALGTSFPHSSPVLLILPRYCNFITMRTEYPLIPFLLSFARCCLHFVIWIRRHILSWSLLMHRDTIQLSLYRSKLSSFFSKLLQPRSALFLLRVLAYPVATAVHLLSISVFFLSFFASNSAVEKIVNSCLMCRTARLVSSFCIVYLFFGFASPPSVNPYRVFAEDILTGRVLHPWAHTGTFMNLHAASAAPFIWFCSVGIPE